MSPAPISRRAAVAGAGAALAAASLPAAVVTATAGTSPMLPAAALPAVFDLQALCNDLIDAGCRITARRPVWTGLGDDGVPSYFILPLAGRGFEPAYAEVMANWSGAIDACPDHVERVVAYAFGQLEET